MPARLQLIARTGHPDFLDLPWDEPLAEWESERLVEVVRGIHRHVVRFVEYEGPIGPGALRAQGAAGADRAARVRAPAQRSRPRRCPSSRRSGWSPTGRWSRGRPDHPASRLLASVPDAVRARQRARPATTAARRRRGAARPPAPGRVLLGRLLALEHALSTRCRGARRLPRRRRDRRDAPEPLGRPARPRPDDRRGERGRRARRRRGGARTRGRAGPGGDRGRARRPLRVALGRADA